MLIWCNRALILQQQKLIQGDFEGNQESLYVFWHFRPHNMYQFAFSPFTNNASNPKLHFGLIPNFNKLTKTSLGKFYVL